MRFFGVIILLVVGLSACFNPLEDRVDDTAVRSAAPQKPNIVLIMADDLGWGDVGYHGSDIHTPALDKLAAEGVQLNRFYTYPSCTQTRGALLSGQRMRTVGLVEPMPPWSDAGLPLAIETLANRFSKQGYRTWKVGKWHLGDHYVEQFPNQRGYDHFYGFLRSEVNYNTHVFASALDWQRNGKTLEEPGYVTHLLTAEAVRLLDDHATDKPFFLDLSFSAPHTPLQAPESAMAEYAHIENYNRQRYAAMVTEMDRGITDVVAAIQRRPDADNTLIIFTSDNGGFPAFGASNKPLRGGKISHYEGGLRVPALAWWPEQLETGIRDQIMGVHDLFPTLLALAGDSPTRSALRPGENVWPAIADDLPIDREHAMVFAFMIPGRPGTPATYSASILQDGWKLIENFSFNRMAKDPQQRYQLRGRELFNIVDDPYEQSELFEQQSGKASELMALLAEVPKGAPIGFKPPPPGWKFGFIPSTEPDDKPATLTPLVEAAIQRGEVQP